MLGDTSRQSAKIKKSLETPMGSPLEKEKDEKRKYLTTLALKLEDRVEPIFCLTAIVPRSTLLLSRKEAYNLFRVRRF